MWISFSSWRRSSPGALVRLSSERPPQAVRLDCSLAKKQASPPALVVVVRGERRAGQGQTPDRGALAKARWESATQDYVLKMEGMERAIAEQVLRRLHAAQGTL